MFGFRRKTQQELDAAFLEAVNWHDFKQAQKLLKKGANVLAQDAGGNTAFHRLTGAANYEAENEINEFAFFLQGQGLDIHARNKQGQACLHLVAEKVHPRVRAEDWSRYFIRCDGPGMMGILLKRGARVGDRDNSGRTVLHAAAALGDADMVNACLKIDTSLITTQDNEGKYPYQAVVAQSVKHHDFLQGLKAKLERCQTPKVEESAVAPAASVSDDNWVLLKPDQVAHVSVEKAIGYKLTEIFNFSSRTYARITHNLETKADVTETRGFDEFSDKSAFAAAREELLRLGGQADEGSVHGQVLDKKRPPFSKDA
ncbi:MAG: ankyrin repeat domain-containing protein [Alphaproteobacteria bacterium]|nr:ankyrin repeat domain-containing protein [Alphaproteobacteria bacterium]